MPQPPRSRQPISEWLTALAVVGVLALLPLQGLAAGASKASVGKAPAAKPVGKATFIDNASSEKPAAREERLKCECRGRPNAGACLGHAS
jgi:hypothetical protein